MAAEPLVGLSRKDYPEYYRFLQRLFAAFPTKPRIAVECDSANSLITEVEAGRGIALASPNFRLVAGKRLLYRPLTGTTEVGSVGIARASEGDVTPAGEKFCEVLRKNSDGATPAKPYGRGGRIRTDGSFDSSYKSLIYREINIAKRPQTSMIFSRPFSFSPWPASGDAQIPPTGRPASPRQTAAN
jgi:hypothetical protein